MGHSVGKLPVTPRYRPPEKPTHNQKRFAMLEQFAPRDEGCAMCAVIPAGEECPWCAQRRENAKTND
jgi:hypothetical protein